MKRIGITYTTTHVENYFSWFSPTDNAEEIELVELSFERNNIQDIHTCDGFVMTGGVDVHPALYGGNFGYENMPDAFQVARDHFESKVYQYAVLHRLPVLGICRGLQLINVLEGGKLVQDLGEDGNTLH